MTTPIESMVVRNVLALASVPHGRCFSTSIRQNARRTSMSHQQNAFIRTSALVLMVVAGAWTLFHLIWNVAQQTSDDY